jgi:hypothetical protein
VKLGERIVRELACVDWVDTLSRWMAHRVAELMERAEQAQSGPEREAARRDCTDLIMRLWAHRAHRLHGRPLAEIASFLEEFTDQMGAARHVPADLDSASWTYVLHRIMQLAAREEDVVRVAAIAEVSLEREREWLAEHRDDLSEDERNIIERLIELQDHTRTGHFRLDDVYIPNFGSLPRDERTRHVLEQLERIHAARQRLTDELKSGAGQLQDVSSEESRSVEQDKDREQDQDSV